MNCWFSRVRKNSYLLETVRELFYLTWLNKISIFKVVYAVNCMPPKKAMFCWPGYTLFEMGIKLTVIEPLIRIKKKILKFLPGKNLLQEKRPKMAFLGIFGAFLVLLHKKCSRKSHETLHLCSSWFNSYIHVLNVNSPILKHCFPSL